MKYNTIIIGSGLAALTTALSISSKNKILIITKEELINSNSYLAQGGIAATTNDDVASHIEDTLYAGSYFNKEESVDEMIKKSNIAIDFLLENNVLFDKEENEFILTKEGGHSLKRIFRAGGDVTGKVIIDSLIKKVKLSKNIDIIENHYFVNLIKDKKNTIGVMCINKNEIKKIYSNNVVLATGGIGNIYNNTTNQSFSKGCGIAAAYRFGANIENMEFIQFHPTAFSKTKNNQNFLISETLRGEGGYLLNSKKERFMEKYHEMLELAPRDIVSRSIFKEIKDTNSKEVYIDVSHMDSDFLKERFPNIYKRCLEEGVDITSDLIPITPVEHYLIGGIKTNLNGETTIDNLYAVGECASTGVHGANRLASNSLLECVVFGMNCANNINKNSLDFIESVDEVLELSEDTHDYDNEIKELRNIMSDNLGIVRDLNKLNDINDYLNKIFKEVSKNEIKNKDYYEYLNILTVCLLISKDAKNRKESLGCHYISEE